MTTLNKTARIDRGRECKGQHPTLAPIPLLASSDLLFSVGSTGLSVRSVLGQLGAKPAMNRRDQMQLGRLERDFGAVG